MIRHLTLAAIVTVLIAVPSASSAAEDALPVNVGTLDAEGIGLDGRTVTLTGEIIGDYGVRTDVVWVQVNDDDYATTPLLDDPTLRGTNRGIGVRYPRELHGEWGSPGGYGRMGPIVEVTGTFRFRSPDDGGETFIDAEEIRLVAPGRSLETPGAGWQLWVGSVLIATGGGLVLAGYRRRLA